MRHPCRATANSELLTSSVRLFSSLSTTMMPVLDPAANKYIKAVRRVGTIGAYRRSTCCAGQTGKLAFLGPSSSPLFRTPYLCMSLAFSSEERRVKWWRIKYRLLLGGGGSTHHQTIYTLRENNKANCLLSCSFERVWCWTPQGLLSSRP